jgi:hypothetical protein
LFFFALFETLKFNKDSIDMYKASLKTLIVTRFIQDGCSFSSFGLHY